MMSVTLSVDHRVIDGALGATFLAAVKENLEHPIGDARLRRAARRAPTSYDVRARRAAGPSSSTARRSRPRRRCAPARPRRSCTAARPAAPPSPPRCGCTGPTRMLPSTAAPAPISTPSPIFGCRSPSSLPVPPSVTECSIETLSPTTAVSPITIECAWSIMMPLPIRAPGMDVDAEHLRGPHLDEVGHVLAPLLPEPVADPVALQRLEPLEEQERLQIAVAGRIALEDRQDVRPRRDAELRVVLDTPRRRSPAGSGRSSPATPASARSDSSAPARGCCGAGCPHARGSPSAARPAPPGPPRAGSSTRPDRGWRCSPASVPCVLPPHFLASETCPHAGKNQGRKPRRA